MFELGASELLLIVIVAVVVIGPKDLPLAMRTAGRWVGKVRRVSTHFRAGFDAMVREAELEEMERKWKEQNEAIMRAHPHRAPDRPEDLMAPLSTSGVAPSASAGPPSAAAESAAGSRPQSVGPGPETRTDPQLPLPPP